LWIAGLCLWFLTIVILLPIITERDAMPGFNQWLRRISGLEYQEASVR
jgi:hypothetical protein